jgi:hypothetical protein
LRGEPPADPGIRADRLDRGGHFAAFEQPELFVDQVRRAFRAMR